jgi:endogenous inhibitor of DNA gyrase (YacG/DUF329 family)
MTANCPTCETSLPEDLFNSDDYHYSGLVKCPSCDKMVSPVQEAVISEFEYQRRQWFGLSPENRDALIVHVCKGGEAGAIAAALLGALPKDGSET